MTLPKRLNLLIAALLVVTLVATLTVNLHTASRFLEDQLRAHARDTATSLAVVVTQALGRGDTAGVELLVNAVFDQGYFRTIRVDTGEDGFAMEKTLPETVRTVPDWFVALVPLPSPEAQAPVMSGWQSTGTVRVQSHPGYAYLQLWNTALRLAGLFVVLGIILGLGAALMLRHILSPLKAVTAQADGISRGEYVQLTPLPHIPELRTMVQALNRMTAKVEQQFAERARTVQRLQELAYLDPLTGLGNRRWLDDRIAALHAHGQGDDEALALLLLRIEGLAELNEARGVEAGDSLLLATARTLRARVGAIAEAEAVRLGGADFAILLAGAASAGADALAEALCSTLSSLHEQGLVERLEVVHIGVAHHRAGGRPGALLALADEALRQAQNAGPNQWAVVHEGAAETGGGGREAWRQRLLQVLEHGAAGLAAQRVVALADGTTVHRELFGRLRVDGQDLPAGLAFPMAESMQLASRLDRLLVETALVHVAAHPGERYAINLATGTVLDSSAPAWLGERLARLTGARCEVSIELRDSAVIQDREAAARWATCLREHGCGFGLDHVGLGFGQIGHLRSLRPDYIKLDGSLISRIAEDGDVRFLVATLVQAAHGLDIQVIAEAVETPAQRETLAELSVDAVQGYLTGRPERID